MIGASAFGIHALLLGNFRVRSTNTDACLQILAAPKGFICGRKEITSDILSPVDCYLALGQGISENRFFRRRYAEATSSTELNKIHE